MRAIYILTLIFSFQLFAQSIESESYEYLVENERKVLKDVAKTIQETDLSVKSNFIYDVEDNFKKIVKDWNKHFEDSQLNNMFKQLAAGQYDDASIASMKKTFKTNRKYAHYIRQHYYLFDKNHTPPKYFKKFVRDFGKLNDHLAIGNMERAQEIAQSLYDRLDATKVEKLKTKFKPLSKNEIVKYITDVQSEINTLAKKSTLNVHEYHTIRKNIKTYLHLYSGVDKASASIRYERLDKIITKLGDLNDLYTNLLNQGKLDEHTHQIEVPKKFKKSIIELSNELHQQGCKLNFL